jgi:hypothetical protein
MTFETGFAVQKKCHGMLFEIKKGYVSASKLSLCYFHIINTRAVHWRIQVFLRYFEEQKLCSGGSK